METGVRSVTALLEVFDMPTSIAFYRALGCEVVAHWGERDDEWDWARLRLGGAELMLNTAYERDERPPAPDPGRVKGHADTELYFECANLDAVCETLRARGITVDEPETTLFGTRRVCLNDPDGFRIWFQSPRTHMSGVQWARSPSACRRPSSGRRPHTRAARPSRWR